MAPGKGNETIEGHIMCDVQVERLVATRRLCHSGAELVDPSRQMQDDGIGRHTQNQPFARGGSWRV